MSHIIVREEEDGYLLYNGNNCGLVRINKTAYIHLFEECNVSSTKYPELVAWLQNNNFLFISGQPEKFQNNCYGHYYQHSNYFSYKSTRSPLNIIWALTPVCNLRCVYCFPDAHSHAISIEQLGTNKLYMIANQIVQAKILMTTLSGGESLLCPDVWGIINYLRLNGVTVSLISNGSLITPEIAVRLKSFNVSVGISIDGHLEAINSATRGENTFYKSVSALRLLIDHCVPVSVLTTVTQRNIQFIGDLVEFAKNVGADSVTLQDLRPFHFRNLYDNLRLTKEQEKSLPDIIINSRKNNPGYQINSTELLLYTMPDSTGKVMQCPAGENFAYIDFYGNMYPCTSLPSFRMGNILYDGSITELWHNSESMKRLRELKSMPIENLPGCVDCSNIQHCEGGCRGDALYYSGDILGRPSRCPY